MIEKVKRTIKENRGGLIALAMVGSTIVGLSAGPIQNYITLDNLDKTHYVTKWGNQIGTSYYGYDDNKDGSIDRIEETGIIPGTRTINIPVRRTHLEGDKDFDFYLSFKRRITYYINTKNEKLTVRETEFPFNSQTVWVDEYPYGSLDAVSSAFATGRGFGFNIIKEGERDFDRAKEHYREEIFPLVSK